jgi:hypothetical protein
MKTCTKCKEIKENLEFYNNISKKDGLSNWCKKCKSNGEKESLEQSKIWYNNWKQEQGCLKCKENRSYVLDLHHIDSSREGDKYKLLSRIISSGTYSFESRKKRILKEAEECIILCSNCHREFHYFEKINGLKIQDYLNN